MYGSIIDIDRDSGVIRVIGEIDYERDPVIELSIVASDAATTHRRTAVAHAVIHVRDHNDEPPAISIHAPGASGLPHVTEGNKSLSVCLSVCLSVNHDDGSRNC